MAGTYFEGCTVIIAAAGRPGSPRGSPRPSEISPPVVGCAHSPDTPNTDCRVMLEHCVRFAFSSAINRCWPHHHYQQHLPRRLPAPVAEFRRRPRRPTDECGLQVPRRSPAPGGPGGRAILRSKTATIHYCTGERFNQYKHGETRRYERARLTTLSGPLSPSSPSSESALERILSTSESTAMLLPVFCSTAEGGTTPPGPVADGDGSGARIPAASAPRSSEATAASFAAEPSCPFCSASCNRMASCRTCTVQKRR